MQQWEYDCTTDKYRPDDELMKMLEIKGKQGWELVALCEVRRAEVDEKIRYKAILKRPIPT